MRLEMVNRGTVGRLHQQSQDIGKCSDDFRTSSIQVEA